MFYETEKNHGLEHNPFKSLVIPRPIGWLSTLSPDGVVNLAPYSQFNMLNYDPPCVMISARAYPENNRLKDTVRNIEQTGEFVFNMATYDLRDAVNKSSTFVGPELDEMTMAGLTPQGRVDVLRIRPLARLGYYDYTSGKRCSRWRRWIPARWRNSAARAWWARRPAGTDEGSKDGS